MNDQRVQEWFEEVAARDGGRVAVERADRSLTYRQLAEGANRVANSLVAAGATKGTTVAIAADDSVEAITALLGVLKAGCVFVPVEPTLPPKRLQAMLAQVSPAWFLVESKHVGAVEPFAAPGRVVCLDGGTAAPGDGRGDSDGRGDIIRFGTRPEHFDASPPRVEYAPDDVAYVYFTSGSTGTPKGIAGRLKGIDHFIRWELETLGLGEGVRVSQLLPVTFDGSLRDIFVPLCAGGTICVPPDRETILDAKRLVEWLDGERVNVVHCVPSLFRSVINEGLRPERFSALRYVLMAGEPLLPADVRRWTEVYGRRTQLVNLYGTSETTLAKFAYFVRPEDAARPSVPVGKPIRGAAAIVVDERGRPCAPGMIGEIYIRTPYRSHGYYNQPELTAQVFVPNPFGDDPRDIVHKTGDYGRVLEDGNFEYLGRRDQQVKVRGMRVELAEVENLLRERPGVEDVAVVAREDTGGNNYLCAYVVFGGEPDVEALRRALAENLPDYMVPSAFVVMKALPRTITGKVDRRALPAPGEAGGGRETAYVAPRTPVEEALAGMWSAVLGLKQVGVNDNFFKSGGHSLLATQVVSRVREGFGVEMPLRALFEAPTVGELALRVEAAMRERQPDAPPPLRRVERGGEIPLSYAQQRLWFIDQMAPGLPFYNMPAVLRLLGPLDAGALRRSLAEVIRRHEVLRTRFEQERGRPRQVVCEPWEPELEAEDLSGLDEAGREREAQRLAGEELRRGFDLGSGRPVRVRLLRLGPEEHIAVLVMHHIVSDAWSMGVLVREVGALYDAFSRGEESPLSELPVQYADFAAWQRDWLQGEVLEQHLDYWRAQLKDLPVLELPTDRSRPAVQTYAGATEGVALGAELSERLRGVCRREGVTLFMLLLAAFKVLLWRYTGQEDVAVGSNIANRTRAETEGLIGFFVNNLVLRTDLGGDPTFRELLGRVRDATLDAYAHQDLPFEKMVEALRPERRLDRAPLFQVVFNLQNVTPPELELSGLTIRQLDAHNMSAKYDLTFELLETPDGLSVGAEYSTELFDGATVGRMLRHYERLLGAVARGADARVSELEMLSEEEGDFLRREVRVEELESDFSFGD